MGVLKGEEGRGEGGEGWAVWLGLLGGCGGCEAGDWGGRGGEVDELGSHVNFCCWRGGKRKVEFTRWLVMIALPSPHLTEKGSLPG